MNFKTWLRSKSKTTVRKLWLHLAAGLVWFSAGLLLIRFAFRWRKSVFSLTRLLLVKAELLLATGINFIDFSKLVMKKIQCISELKGEKVGLFAFPELTDYLLVCS
jgi:hypothetical protein